MSFLDRILGREALEEELLHLRREVRRLEAVDRPEPRSAATPLLPIARALRDARTIEEFAGAALGALLEAVGGTGAGLLVEEPPGHFAPLAVAGRLPTVSQGICSEVARTGQPLATGEAAADARLRTFASVKDFGLESVVCLPVIRRIGATACLYVVGGKGGLERATAADLLASADLLSIGLDRLALEEESSQRVRLEAVGLASASIAHDLATPLATAELALSALAGTDERSRASAQIASRAIARAREIARGLASFARGQERTIDLAPLELAPLVDEHLREVEGLLDAAGVQVVRGALEGRVVADRSALLRILSNLARNASEATGRGGTITYDAVVAGRDVALRVTDDGPGVPEARARFLFRPFATFGKPGGCGLGLAMAQDLARAMGGRIDHERPASGRGARFAIVLKVSPVDAGHSPCSSA